MGSARLIVPIIVTGVKGRERERENWVRIKENGKGKGKKKENEFDLWAFCTALLYGYCTTTTVVQKM